jgi:gamma-butyrobetaine dioxygenase
MRPQSQAMTTDERHLIAKLNCQIDHVAITWADGHVSRFPAIWLRHNCVCPECGSTETARRELRLTDIPRDIAAQQAQLNSLGQVVVTWTPGSHQSAYEPKWLRAHCLSEVEREQRRHKPVIWHPQMDGLIRYQSFPDLQDARVRLRFLEHLRDYGFVILTEVTYERAATEQVAAVVGSLRMTNYGIYELISRPSPQLVGDSAVPLAPHTDEPYRHNPPGITFFHVLAQSAVGGESTLVDGYYIAELLREHHAEAFRILSAVPIGFHRILKEGPAFYASGPVIRLNRTGHVDGIRLLDRGTAPFDIPEHMVVDYYDALRILLTYIYDPKHSLTVKIEAGQMLVFNNQRMLHGRTAFDPKVSHRHVRSCNVDLDEFYSSLRVAYRELEREEAYMTLPQGAGT